MFLVCVWYVHIFPEGKWRRDMKMCLKLRDFHFPICLYWKSGVRGWMMRIPLSPVTLRGLVSCVRVISLP